VNTEETMTATKPDHTIAALCVRSDAISRDKGWVDDANPRPFYSSTALMHTELSEALEDFRGHRDLDEVYYEYQEGGVRISILMHEQHKREGHAPLKPCGIPMELADFVIRICQECGTTGRGAELDRAFNTFIIEGGPVIDGKDQTFEEMIADAHLFTSMAWSAVRRQVSNGVQDLAAALSIVFAFCHKNGVDLWAAIDEKEAFNRTRPHRHGGKRL
jgi:hypothetical protein